MRVACNREGILKASEIIRDGGVAVFPTDTVYGIGCSPYLAESVSRIYRIKSRDPSKRLPLLVGSMEDAKRIAAFDQKTERIAGEFWPGALTVILDVTDQKLKESLGLEDKVAVRVPDNRCTLELLARTGPLTGTSANISGEEPFDDPQEFPEGLECDVFVDGGPIGGRGQSTIIEVAGDEVRFHRTGAVSREKVLRA